MNTTEIINKALKVLNSQDWYWYMSDYQVSEMKDKAYSSMRYFVELISAISDSTIRKAMRELWMATYNYKSLSSPMSSPTDKEVQEYNNTKAELMAVILPSRYNIAA
ncbi:hypothetical protein [Bacteroides sp. Marseille-P3684]|uniref:hypothetical protein n=1 Tax=Bacteroides sp. Marseille-P3684 TaxID=2086579 RepID=UPI000D0BB8E9|nr:hypothetical protein [Bacteroides sp. Marseille-P3684]